MTLLRKILLSAMGAAVALFLLSNAYEAGRSQGRQEMYEATQAALKQYQTQGAEALVCRELLEMCHGQWPYTNPLEIQPKDAI